MAAQRQRLRGAPMRGVPHRFGLGRNEGVTGHDPAAVAHDEGRGIDLPADLDRRADQTGRHRVAVRVHLDERLGAVHVAGLHVGGVPAVRGEALQQPTLHDQPVVGFLARHAMGPGVDPLLEPRSDPPVELGDIGGRVEAHLFEERFLQHPVRALDLALAFRVAEGKIKRHDEQTQRSPVVALPKPVVVACCAALTVGAGAAIAGASASPPSKISISSDERASVERNTKDSLAVSIRQLPDGMRIPVTDADVNNLKRIEETLQTGNDASVGKSVGELRKLRDAPEVARTTAGFLALVEKEDVELGDVSVQVLLVADDPMADITPYCAANAQQIRRVRGRNSAAVGLSGGDAIGRDRESAIACIRLKKGSRSCCRDSRRFKTRAGTT